MTMKSAASRSGFPAPAMPPLTPDAVAEAPRAKGRARRVRVLFHNQEGPGGTDDVFVSVNGRAYLIRREAEVDVPPEVLAVIENATQTVFEQGGDGLVRPRQVKRYAYSLLGERHDG